MTGRAWTASVTRPIDRTYLDTLGPVSGLRWSSQLPGGDKAASCVLDLPGISSPPAIREGRLFGVTLGGRDAWSGTLTSQRLARGGGRALTADGDSAELTRFIAYDEGDNIFNLPVVIGYAVDRGMRAKPGTLRPAPAGSFSRGSLRDTIDKPINEVADLLGCTWEVRDGLIRMFDYPTVPTVQLLAHDDGVGRTTAEYVSNVIGKYQKTPEVLGTVQANGDTPPALRSGTEVVLDLTTNFDGVMAQATALEYARRAYSRLGYRTRFTDDITVLPGEALNAGGVPLDARRLRAGFVARVQLLDVARGGEPVLAPTDVLIGGVQVDNDSGVVTCTPFDSSRDSLSAVLADVRQQATA